MRTRVLYIPPHLASIVASLPFEELGRVDNGVWIACPDETVRTLAQYGQPMFLYFDRADYETFVAELSPVDVQGVIRRRRDRWMPNSLNYAMLWLFNMEAASLEASARSLVSQAGSTSAAGTLEKSLALLQRLAGLERYEMVPPKAMAFNILEGESQVLAEIHSALEGAIPGMTPEDRSELNVHYNARRNWARVVTEVIAMLGGPSLGGSLTYSNPARGIYMHPASDERERALTTSGEIVIRWREGLVHVLAERHIEELRNNGSTVHVLYPSGSDLYDSFEFLTLAQLNRDFAARLGWTPAQMRRDVLHSIDRLHLHQILMKSELGSRPDAASACRAAGFGRVATEEVDLLGRSLLRTRSFSARRQLDSIASSAELFSTADALALADLKLLSDLATRFGAPAGPALERIRIEKTGATDQRQ